MKTYTIHEDRCIPGLPVCFAPEPNTDIRVNVKSARISTEKAPGAIKMQNGAFAYGAHQIIPCASQNDSSGFIAVAFNPNEYRPADETSLLIDYREHFLLVLYDLSVPSGPILLSKDNAFTITSDGQLQAMPTEKPREKCGYEIL